MRLAREEHFLFPSAMILWHLRLGFVVGFLSTAHAAPNPLETIANCTLIPTEWADGDSFRVRTPAGKELTVRLYGADCVEFHVSDDSDSRRLRDQRRYFGITEVKGDALNPIDFAKNFGKQAAEFTATLLKNPFAIHTRMQGALGDGKHPRFYAFVETADDRDLATELVKAGLARARGVSTDGPGERSRERYKEILNDIELQAAKRGVGVWGFTDWDKLPAERDTQRLEDEEDKIGQGKESLPADFRLNPNLAGRDDLDKLPGIGETLADRIIEAREDAPFEKPEDLMRVPGIKQMTLDKFRHHLEFAKPLATALCDDVTT